VTGAGVPAAGPPPMPWRLVARDAALAVPVWVPLEQARPRVPRRYRVLPLLPGRTLGGLFLAEYGPGSTLRYRELIVASATLLHRGRLAAWVTHVFVDDPASVRGGRELLGVPKQLASFDWRDGRVEVRTPEHPVCCLRHGRTLWLWRQTARLVALHGDVRDPERVSLHGNEVRGRLGLARAAVEIPPRSPLRALGFGAALPALRIGEMEAVFGGAPFFPPRTQPVATDSPEGG
jgi:acetoacetate decarboxylase